MTQQVNFDITFVLPRFSPRPVGGFRVVYEYASLLAQHGWRVRVVHSRERPTGRARWLYEAVLVVAYILGRRVRPAWFDLPPEVEVLNTRSRDLRVLSGSRVIVASAVGTADFVAHAVERESATGIYLVQGIETFAASRADVERTWNLPLRKITVSPWLHSELRASGVQSTLISNSVDVALFHPEGDYSVRGPSVLAMISESPWKRTDLVVEAFNIISAAVPRARLTTFGTCDRPIGLPESAMHLTRPDRSRLADLYREHSVFLCTSEFEGFGLPALEAIASGAVVVSTRNGGVESFASDVAIFSARKDGSELAELVIEALRARTDSALRSSAGVEVAQEFSDEIRRARVISYFEEALGAD